MTIEPMALGRRAGLLAGSAMGLLAVGQAAPAIAAEAVDAPLTITGQASVQYKVDAPSLAKMTEATLNTPQTIETVSQDLMRDRGEVFFNDALRNVSGASLGAGESSWQGSNVSIRGFNARNDMFLDGMRDFASYYRDPFNLDEIQVVEGPSSFDFGRGSTGGAINQVTKQPTLASIVDIEGVVGTDATKRLSADVGGAIPVLGSTAAFRIDAMDHESMEAGRPIGAYRRYGVAPSVAWGLGADTRVIASWFHQTEADTPDYGLPWLLGKPAPVPRDTFYGFKSDFLNTSVDIETIKVEHDFGDNITVRDQARYEDGYRHWRDTEPQPAGTITAATPLTSINVNRAEQLGHSRETMGDNQLDLMGKFNILGVPNDVAVGSEVIWERSTPEYDNVLGAPATPLLNPNTSATFSGTTIPRAIVYTRAFTYSFYATDTIKLLNDKLELNGGIRWDSFASDYAANFFSATNGAFTSTTIDNRVDQAPSYRAGILYKPVANGSIYFDYGTSFNPSAEALSEIVAVRSFNQGNLFLDPEKNIDYQAGVKWSWFGDKLYTDVAVFREEKQNARVPNPSNSALNILGGDFQVTGWSASASGHITSAWQINANFTSLSSRVIKSDPGGPLVGTQIYNAPNASGNVWTTYAITDKLTVGGGINYMGVRIGNSALPYNVAPSYTTGDLMAKYQVTSNIRVQVNVTNVGDAYYIDQIHGFHVVPGEARTALFTLAYSH